VTAVARETGQ